MSQLDFYSGRYLADGSTLRIRRVEGPRMEELKVLSSEYFDRFVSNKNTSELHTCFGI